MRSELSATNAHHRESEMKALIRPMKSVAGQELQRGNGIVPVSAAKSRVLIPRVKVL
jgi:hypothetical protein